MNLKQLYDRDYNFWLETTKRQLKNREFDAVDLENSIEEIDDMGKSQKRSLDSYAQRLIEHLLKLQYWDEESERCSKGWRREVNNFRIAIAIIFKA